MATSLVSTAWAADIVEPAAYDWTGPYVGLQAGYGWGKADAGPVVLQPLEDGSIDADGFLGGLHAGYNLQSGNFVFGIEGDGEFADLSGDTDVNADNFGALIGSIEKEIDWLASLRLRAGLAADRVLIYATGGLAIGGIDAELDPLPVAVPVNGTPDGSDTAFGWTIGGGLEYALSDAVSARIEYRYTDLENTEITNGVDATFEFENDFHAVRGGISWHF